MHLSELTEKLKQIRPYTNINAKKNQTSTSSSSFTVFDLDHFKEILEELEAFRYFDSYITAIRKSNVFQKNRDVVNVSEADYRLYKMQVVALQSAIDSLVLYYDYESQNGAGIVKILLPEISSFDDLSKYSKELKIAVESVINKSDSEEHLKILTAEPGSIWIIASVGIIGISILGKICQWAYNLRVAHANAKRHEILNKQFSIATEMLEATKEAHKKYFDKILEDGANEIAGEYFKTSNSAEALLAIKTSVEVISGFMEKGGKLLPNDPTIKENGLFPDYNDIKKLGTEIKELKEQAS